MANITPYQFDIYSQQIADIKAESLDSEPSFAEIQERVNIGGDLE